MLKSVKSIFNWSGGKDSALALYHCLKNPELDIKYLVTTINDAVDWISMHGVRTELLIKQAESIGIPLYQIRPCLKCLVWKLMIALCGIIWNISEMRGSRHGPFSVIYFWRT